MAEEGDPKSILRLPDDCLLHIFTHLQDVHDIVALRITNRRLNELSRAQVVWRTQLRRQEIFLHLPRFSPDVYEHPTEELERLATSRFRLKHNLRLRKLEHHSVQSYALVKQGSTPLKTAPGVLSGTPEIIEVDDVQIIRASAWISPGWLVTGGFVYGSGQSVSCINVWDTGHSTLTEPPLRSVANCRLPSIPGSIFEITVSREQVEDNTYLVLACPWMKAAWSLTRVSIPLPGNDLPPKMEEIDTIVMSHGFRSTAHALRGDYIALLSDLPGTRGSVFLWNWREATCLRFRVESQFDFNPNALADTDGCSPILIAPPYIIYVRTHTLSLHIVPIPTGSLKPLASYPLMDPPTEKFPGWSTFLPWHPAYRTPHIRFTLLENTPDRIVINIDFCRNRHTAECKLVIAKGSGTQHLAGGDVEFDFDAHFEDVRLEDYQEKRLSVGSNVGVPGTTGWFSTLKPRETDFLLRRVLALPEYSSAQSEDGVDRRLFCPEDRVQERVSFDPMLGRLCVIAGGFHTFSIIDVQ